MIEYIENFEWNGLLGICLYWIPAAFCFYGYTVRSWIRYQEDVKSKADVLVRLAKGDYGSYYPQETIGSLLGRAALTVLPVCNLFSAIFDVAPEVFRRFFGWIERVFDQPLVSKIKN